MPGRQQTFDLIPTTVARSNGAKPPMTSKAAKKAYLKANRGPKISRAEQRRIEAEERAQQRDEYEKQRNAQRAKDARERKAQKEQAQKDARKKMGLPEPSKFVRASQPTISRFIVSGAKRSWQEMEIAGESNDTTSEQEDDDCLAAERVAVDVGDASGEEFGDLHSISLSDLDSIDDSAKVVNEEEETCQVLPQLRSYADEDEYNANYEQISDELVTAQLLSETAEASHRSDDMPPPEKSSSWSNGVDKAVGKENVDMVVNSGQLHSGKPRQALTERSMNVPRPAKIPKTISFAPSPPKPVRSSLAINEANDPPSATQVFLENNLDDFFPSPSQEIRELLVDADDLPSNTQIARELNLDKAVCDEDSIAAMFSSQDFIMSSQDIRELNTPSRAPPGRDKSNVPALAQAAQKEKGRFFEEKEEDLLEAAIHESKIAAVQEERQIEPAQKASGPEKRTLQRVQSTVTDYGDDEFFDKEFLALL